MTVFLLDLERARSSLLESTRSFPEMNLRQLLHASSSEDPYALDIGYQILDPSGYSLNGRAEFRRTTATSAPQGLKALASHHTYFPWLVNGLSLCKASSRPRDSKTILRHSFHETSRQFPSMSLFLSVRAKLLQEDQAGSLAQPHCLAC